MSRRRVAFLGGNGHCAARLTAAREAALARGVAVDDVSYPGFEGRVRVPSLSAFLEDVARGLGTPDLVYATGIGGLLALLLRAQDRLAAPLVLQAPVLWGLEQRRMPGLLRVPAIARLARHLFRLGPFQSWFVATHFERPLAPERRRAFFDGYAACTAFADLFVWLGPPVLRELEARRAERPQALDGITVWWGGRDRVVAVGELRLCERALGRTLPLRVFPDWGHYPMIDVPDEWAAALAGTLPP
jgi:pimeloyl-ACP methyl ester carboxylesterase